MGLTPSQSIEDLQAGDLIYAHTGEQRPIVHKTIRRYSGTMIGISHEQEPATLWLTIDHLVLTARRVQQLSRDGEWSGIPSSHVDFARSMRHQATPPEAHLWQRLRGNQLDVTFRRQHQIGPYIADFYCRQAGLVVEVDGAGTHSSDEARDYDRQRDTYLSALGLRVMRFTASDVFSRIDAVLEAILQATHETVLPDDPEKQWRYAGSLVLGDIVCFGIDRQPVAVASLTIEETVEELYDLKAVGAHSFLTDVCAIHADLHGARSAVSEE